MDVWTKTYLNVYPLTLTPTVKHKNLFEKTKWRLFSGKCSDTLLSSCSNVLTWRSRRWAPLTRYTLRRKRMIINFVVSYDVHFWSVNKIYVTPCCIIMQSECIRPWPLISFTSIVTKKKLPQISEHVISFIIAIINLLFVKLSIK